MRARPMIHSWQIDRMFGTPVLRGYLTDGTKVVAPLLWWSHGYFGTRDRVIEDPRNRRGDFKVGVPHHNAFPSIA